MVLWCGFESVDKILKCDHSNESYRAVLCCDCAIYTVLVSFILATMTVTATETSLENITSCYFYYFAIIPIRSTCTMWAKYPGTKLMHGVQVRRENEKFTIVCSRLLHKTFNLVISGCCFAKDGKEMYKNI